MSKADQLNDARLQGMQYALNQIKKIGIEEFEKEMKWRSRVRIYFTITPQEIKKASDRMQGRILQIVRTMAMIVLHDEFDFGKKRLFRFNERYNKKVQALNEDYVTWQDYDQVFEEITGERLEMDWLP